MILSYRSLLSPPPTVAPIYTTRICDGRWRLYKEIMRWRLYMSKSSARAYIRISCGGAYIHDKNMRWPLAPIQGGHAVAPIYITRICNGRWRL